MATTTQKKKSIRYLNRDFVSFKADLIEHLKTYFGSTVQDFSDGSVGMLFTDLVSFVGDNLSFYLDKKFDESFIETAKETKNIFKHAKMLGFKPFGKSSAVGTIDAYLQVPAINSNGTIIPDMRYAGTIKRGAKCKNAAGKVYEILLDVDFSKVNYNDPNFVQVADRDSETDQPISFALKVKDVEIKAGETKTASFTIGAYEAFKKITLSDDDVLEVLKIVDSEGNQWYECDFLAQDTIFDGVANTGENSTEVPYILKLRSVPFRFITDFDITTNRMSITFGTGDAQTFDGELIPDLGDLSLPLYGKDTFTDFSLDPQNFLKTRTLGLAPVNTTLTVYYRVGGGLDTNSATSEINTVAESVFDVGNTTLDSNIIRDVGNSFSVLNSKPVQGGRDEISIDEIKCLISAYFATQCRIVTIEDLIVRAMSMPSRFGSVFRASARPSQFNKNSTELSVLSQDSNGYVTTCPNNLKKNLKTYLGRFRMLTDSIDVLDGEVINIGLDVEVLSNPDFSKAEIAASCIDSLMDYFDTSKWSLGQPINLSSLHSLLTQIPGVLSVTKLNINNFVGNIDGRVYSNTSFDVKSNTKNNIVYCKDGAIFEVKFKTKDISCVVK